MMNIIIIENMSFASDNKQPLCHMCARGCTTATFSGIYTKKTPNRPDRAAHPCHSKQGQQLRLSARILHKRSFISLMTSQIHTTLVHIESCCNFQLSTIFFCVHSSWIVFSVQPQIQTMETKTRSQKHKMSLPHFESLCIQSRYL